MVFVSITCNNNNNDASYPRDLGKKKRANRSAKLKQCKLDARREQWLSQGVAVKKKKKKGVNEEVSGALLSPVVVSACEKEIKGRALESLEMIHKGRGGGLLVTREEEEETEVYSDSLSNSPTGSSILGRMDSSSNFTGSSSSSSSSSSSGSSASGCCYSGNITKEEEDEEGREGEDNCLDDWEAVADALAVDDDHHNPEVVLGSSRKYFNDVVALDSDCNFDKSGSSQGYLKKESTTTVPPRLALGSSRAWRPDDVFRPQSLPNLSKQPSFVIGDWSYTHEGGKPWACPSTVNVPSSCPICCEELDCTDTSFLPCLCGFRLCLFCHKRILEIDGRCPGCRKPYK